MLLQAPPLCGAVRCELRRRPRVSHCLALGLAAPQRSSRASRRAGRRLRATDGDVGSPDVFAMLQAQLAREMARCGLAMRRPWPWLVARSHPP